MKSIDIEKTIETVKAQDVFTLKTTRDALASLEGERALTRCMRFWGDRKNEVTHFFKRGRLTPTPRNRKSLGAINAPGLV